MSEIFEYATQNKVRFDTQKGNLTSEQLFDLPLESKAVAGSRIRVSLEGIWIKLNKRIKDADTSESPLKGKTGSSKHLAIKFAIVSRIIEIRVAQRDAAKNALDKKAKNEQIMRLIADKENDALAGKSIEELKSLLD